jgi:hypothetical protein
MSSYVLEANIIRETKTDLFVVSKELRSAASIRNGHLTIQVVYAANVETEHISTERMLEVIRNENGTFTPDELKHFEKCDPCFYRWAECARNESPDLLS